MRKNSTYIHLPGEKYFVIQKSQLKDYLSKGYIQGTGIPKEEYARRQEKIQKTMLERYGVRTGVELPLAITNRFTDDAKERAKITRDNYFFENFGVHNNTQLPDFKEKFHAVIIEKFGSIENAYKVRNEHSIQTNKEKYGVEWSAQADEPKQHFKETCIELYGVDSYAKTLDYHKKAKKHFKYDNTYFDSSWELALWIYAKDHNEEIERNPCYFEYEDQKGKKHRYFPDFKYKDFLLEIKGDHLLDENCSLKISDEKYQCMIDNGIVIWKSQDIQFVLDYIKEKYGKNYLNSFIVKKKEK